MFLTEDVVLMNKKYLKDRIESSLESFINDIENFSGNVGEKLGQLGEMMAEDDEYQNDKSQEVTVLSHEYEHK
jgi:hypothetical protein